MENKLQSFTSDGTLVAICNSNAILKIWDTNSGFLEHEFQPSEYLSSSATCIRFSPKNSGMKKNLSTNIHDNNEQLLAIGTLEGAVLVYNHTKKEVIAKLQYSTSSPVTDMCWHSSSELITIGQANTLIYWNIYSKAKLREIEIQGFSSVCLLGENALSVASNNLYFLRINPKTNERKEFKLVGHNTSIIQSVPIFLDAENKARYVLTIAENDRFVYAWSTNWKQMEPVASFMVKDIVKTVTYINLPNSSIGVAVSTRKGHMKYFSHHLNGSKLNKPIKSIGSLKICSNSNDELLLPILGTYFLSSTTLLFVYGTDLFPQCERILVEELKGEIRYTRKDPSLFTKKKSTLIKTVTPLVTKESIHLLPTQSSLSEIKEVNKRKKGDASLNLPMEERLNSVFITKDLSSTIKGRPMDNYVQLLVQALHSKDSVLLSNILLKGEEEEEIIHNTIKRLPVGCVVPFLQYLQEVIAGKGIKNLSFITWIKSVFYHHMSHLSSISDKETLMQPFYVVCASRTSTLATISKLHSRINLLLTHVKTRHDNAIQKMTDQYDALLVYKEESSDDEDMHLGMSGLHSESEDNWDFLTEDDDDNESSLINNSISTGLSAVKKARTLY